MASHPTQSDAEVRSEIVKFRDWHIWWLSDLKVRNPEMFAEREAETLVLIERCNKQIDAIDNPPKVWPGMFHFIGPISLEGT